MNSQLAFYQNVVVFGISFLTFIFLRLFTFGSFKNHSKVVKEEKKSAKKLESELKRKQTILKIVKVLAPIAPISQSAKDQYSKMNMLFHVDKSLEELTVMKYVYFLSGFGVTCIIAYLAEQPIVVAVAFAIGYYVSLEPSKELTKKFKAAALKLDEDLIELYIVAFYEFKVKNSVRIDDVVKGFIPIASPSSVRVLNKFVGNCEVEGEVKALIKLRDAVQTPIAYKLTGYIINRINGADNIMSMENYKEELLQKQKVILDTHFSKVVIPSMNRYTMTLYVAFGLLAVIFAIGMVGLDVVRLYFKFI